MADFGLLFFWGGCKSCPYTRGSSHICQKSAVKARTGCGGPWDEGPGIPAAQVTTRSAIEGPGDWPPFWTRIIASRREVFLFFFPQLVQGGLFQRGWPSQMPGVRLSLGAFVFSPFFQRVPTVGLATVGLAQFGCRFLEASSKKYKGRCLPSRFLVGTP